MPLSAPLSISTGPSQCALNQDEVHVWHASLAQAPEVRARLARVLSPPELEQATRYRPALRRSRFMTGRAIQRDILSRYTRVAADALVFARSQRGKPHLAGAPASSEVTFNVSHSGDMIVCAVALGRTIGIDIEEIRAVRESAAVSHRLFSSADIAALEATPPMEKDAAFLRAWVRREACAKALGRSVLDRPDPGDPSWVLQPLDVGPRYVGELVVEGLEPFHVRHFGWAERSTD